MNSPAPPTRFSSVKMLPGEYTAFSDSCLTSSVEYRRSSESPEGVPIPPASTPTLEEKKQSSFGKRRENNKKNTHLEPRRRSAAAAIDAACAAHEFAATAS